MCFGALICHTRTVEYKHVQYMLPEIIYHINISDAILDIIKLIVVNNFRSQLNSSIVYT